MQQITTQQQQSEEWTSSTRETEAVNTSTNAASAILAKMAEQRQESVRKEKIFGRVDVIKIALLIVFLMGAFAWILKNMPYLLTGKVFSLHGFANYAAIYIIYLMATASAKAIASVIDSWLTARTRQMKKD